MATVIHISRSFRLLSSSGSARPCHRRIPPSIRLWNVLNFFTIWSNILVTVVAYLLARDDPSPARGHQRHQRVIRLRGGIDEHVEHEGSSRLTVIRGGASQARKRATC
jgi:hypothetical protein